MALSETFLIAANSPNSDYTVSISTIQSASIKTPAQACTVDNLPIKPHHTINSKLFKTNSIVGKRRNSESITMQMLFSVDIFINPELEIQHAHYPKKKKRIF